MLCVKDVITADSDITGHIEFIPLANNAEEWAKEYTQIPKLLRIVQNGDKWSQMQDLISIQKQIADCLFRGVTMKEKVRWLICSRNL